MTDWQKFEPYITPLKVREELGSALHNNNNVKNLEDDWLETGRKLDRENVTNSNVYFSDLEKRLKK